MDQLGSANQKGTTLIDCAFLISFSNYTLPQQDPGIQPLDDGFAPQHPVPAASGTPGVSLPVSDDVEEISFSR
ncbi:protein of unknown function [Maridesulfovibrio hydrothermalis AM13 = DSM 14728]|uniref:Uncharacterized protein n=1 Tax=Maridesulfovibrio hydrothermalis AM13 = DSM 14728 TaxID=1121451 RepID=L0R5V1_9BACT|nr:protein of unknown function [Maridesulfovibrio hydrothermalis AM13 = DSM 14728]